MRPPREDTEPWYKQFWPWFLISLPLSVVIASLVTINIAIESDDGLVSDDYYKEGLAINEDKRKVRKAAAMNLTAELSLDENGLIIARLPEHAAYLPFLMLKLTHPGDASKDMELPLSNNGAAVFTSNDPLDGTNIHWHLVITPPDTEWKLRGRWRPDALKIIRISPST